MNKRTNTISQIKAMRCLLTVAAGILFTIMIFSEKSMASDAEPETRHNKIEVEVASAFFYKMSEELDPDIYTCIFSSTNKIFQDLASGQISFAIATEPNEEQQALLNNSGHTFTFLELFTTPIVIYVNSNNNTADITLSRLSEMYSSCCYWPDTENEVINFRLTDDNGSQHCIKNIIGESIIDSCHRLSKDMPSIISDVENEENGIGYAFWEYYKTTADPEKTKILTINNREYSDADYDLIFPVYLIILIK